MYGFHRFTDTLVGLVVALLVNVVIRPYNNRQKIINMMNEIQKMFLPLLQARVLEHRYPDLTPLTEKMTSLASELRIFEKQPGSAVAACSPRGGPTAGGGLSARL